MRTRLLAIAMLAGCTGLAAAQDGPIQDNSFLLHEAYNQPDGRPAARVSGAGRMSSGSA